MQKKSTSKNIIHQVYGKVIILTFLCHIFFTIIFAALSITPLIFYNIFSCVFYAGLYFLSRKGHYRSTVILLHLEICLFVALSCGFLGWDLGFSIYLIALSSLVYFCPFDRKYIPYLFSIMEILLFLLLKLYTVHYAPVVTLDEGLISTFYVFNSLASFTLILYAAFVSKLSAVLTEQTLIKSNTKLQDMVDHDPLTHLWSRPHLTGRFHEIIDSEVPITIVLADIDNFKHINDTYGHDCGDYILSELASLLKSMCPKNSGVCRWGGEEFVLMFQQENLNTTIQLVNEIRKTIADYHFKYDTQSLYITMTFGISNSTESKELSTLIQLADKRMYHGKHTGKNTVITADFKLPAD